MKCVANDPSTLVCDDEGLPSLGELSSDACGAQWNDLMACWCVGQAASGPPADQQAAVEACEYNCEEMANLSCADPSCTQACGQLGPMQLGWPAIAAMAECQSTFTSSDYECTADGVSQVKDGMGFACIGPVHAALICSLAMLAVCDVTMCEAECSDNLCLNLPMSTACKTCVETKYFAAP